MGVSMKSPGALAGATETGTLQTVYNAENTQSPSITQAKDATQTIAVGSLKAIISACDADLARQYVWCPGGTGGRYAVALLRDGSSLRTVYLHRLIMGAGNGEIVDHIDGDPLNCCRSNLRFVSKSENGANRASTSNSSGYRNVAFSPKRGRYQARVWKQGGVFRGPYRQYAEAAARDADTLLRAVYPGLTRLNFPEIGELEIQRKTGKAGHQ